MEPLLLLYIYIMVCKNLAVVSKDEFGLNFRRAHSHAECWMEHFETKKNNAPSGSHTEQSRAELRFPHCTDQSWLMA